jgi:site-specific DNA-methyltransferase (adenine-specific)
VIAISKGKSQPDILEVISDLSNDEVFTPPKLANQVLDLLPLSVWSNPKLRFLDPAAKTGVFLREVTRRLMSGLEGEFPDADKRLDHILKNMVFGAAITELTSLMSRRTLYCSKDASSEHSIVKFPSTAGNVWFERIEHSFLKGRCSQCNAPREIEREGRDNYAYGFIHANGRKLIEGEGQMKFDVIVGNPPYQMDDAGGHRPVPLYNKFVEQAIALNPAYIAMITPSRWTAGGLGLNDYRSKMLADDRIRAFVDYPVASELFPGVEIKGGVSYFLWDRDNRGLCKMTLVRGENSYGPVERAFGEFDVLVRDSRALPILHKVLAAKDQAFNKLVASVRPFGDELRSNFKKFSREQTSKNQYKLYMNEGFARQSFWVDKEYVKNNTHLVEAWKVLLPTAGSDGGQKLPDVVLGKPLIGEPGSVCTETYLAIGPFQSEDEANNAASFLKGRFARFLISIRKPAQHNVPSTFSWVPQQDWSKPISDEQMYAKYGITDLEQAYIEEMIKEMQ